MGGSDMRRRRETKGFETVSDEEVNEKRNESEVVKGKAREWWEQKKFGGVGEQFVEAEMGKK
jgi:hypothetical protein